MVYRVVFIVTCVAALSMERSSFAADTPTAKKVPANHSIVANTINGWYFVPKELKEEFDQTLSRMESLAAEVDSGRMKAKDAQAELDKLATQLTTLRQVISSSRIHVEGAKIHEQVEKLEFELGPEKRLAITANHVRVIGWNGPNVKCELRKMVLTPNDPDENAKADEQLQSMKSLKMVHRHERAEFAGKTKLEAENEEREYLANQGKDFTDEQLRSRRRLIDAIQRSREIHHDYVGKIIDLLSIEGLDYQSNKVISMQVKSDGGDGQWTSVRQRYAVLTVFVPPCSGVCIRGARRGLEVEQLSAPLVIVDEESTDTDHRGKFEVRGLKGDLSVREFPLRRIEDIEGKLTMSATLEYGVERGGTSHAEGFRELHSSQPISISIRNVTNGASLKFCRANLELTNVAGALDVENDFGNTKVVRIEKLPESAHRIVTQSGRIDIRLSANAWKSVPIVAATNHGSVRTNIPREQFEDFHLSGQDMAFTDIRRSWSGFRTPDAKKDPLGILRLLDRFIGAVNNNDRPVGLDLISRNGRIEIIREDD